VRATGDADTQRRRTTFAVLNVLAEWSEFDTVTLWWISRAASLLSRTQGRPAFGEALDLLEALRLSRTQGARSGPERAESRRGFHAN